MNSRERFVKTLDFDQPDRIFYSFGNPRKSMINSIRTRQAAIRTIGQNASRD
jgi:hypothetical protein